MEITEIKQRLTLAIVLQHYGLTPDKNSRLNCPFHDDKTPSMQVYPKTNTVYCFSGNCKTHGKSMDVIDFIMYIENITKAEAITKATELLGEVKPMPTRTKEYQELPMDKLEEVFYKMKANLKQSKTAIAYCEKRSLDLNRLEIGYNGRTYKGILHCIVFPLKDKANKIVSFYGRHTVNEEKDKHFYLKDSRGLYPQYPSVATRHLIITESVIDAASLLQLPNITKEYSILAAYGTNRLSAEHIEAIKIWAVAEPVEAKEIIFAFDNDNAGNKATSKYINELILLFPGLKFTKLTLPNNDINDTLLAHDESVFEHLLNQRTEIFFSSGEPPQANESFFSNEKSIEKENSIDVPTQNSTFNTQNSNKLIYQTITATYTIKGGLDKQMNKLMVTLEIEKDDKKSRNKLDLYEDKQIEKLANEVAEKLHIDYSLLLTDLQKLTDLLDEYREQQNQSESEESKQAMPAITMLTTEERQSATDLASDPNLVQTITNKLTQSGIIGEDENKTFLFIIAASHIQENPLNALIQGSSGSGKTNLLKGIYKIMPDEDKKIFSRCSEKMLYNVPKYYFKNKLICFEDVDGLGEEAEYAWRELVSNGQLISGVSYKDDKGNIGIKELTVYGPITSIACTTKGAIYADNMSRLFLIAIDESKAQTQRINEYQAQEAQGIINKYEQKQAIKLLQNYVRILQPYQVHNPFATKLKLPENIRDERRLYRLYLYFIDMITVLHQHQRQRRASAGNKLIATKQDCQIAKDLLFECIMLKMDELDGSLRQFFERLKDHVKKQNNHQDFTQREIRETLKISKTHLQRFINELIELEYLQQISSHPSKGNRYKIQYFDDYQKVRTETKEFLQKQLDEL
jgi:DNA primase/energy-coupling factor transporter ATP-binding protein EcfA2